LLCQDELKKPQRFLLHCGTCRQGFHLKCFETPPPRSKKFFCTKCTGINTKFGLVCDGGQDEDKILMCDSCDEGYHMYCLPEVLDRVPAGIWICPACTLTPTELNIAKLNFIISEMQQESAEILSELAQAASEQYVALLEDTSQTPEQRSPAMRRIASTLYHQYQGVCKAATKTFDFWTDKFFSIKLQHTLLTHKVLDGSF